MNDSIWYHIFNEIATGVPCRRPFSGIKLLQLIGRDQVGQVEKRSEVDDLLHCLNEDDDQFVGDEDFDEDEDCLDENGECFDENGESLDENGECLVDPGKDDEDTLISLMKDSNLKKELEDVVKDADEQYIVTLNENEKASLECLIPPMFLKDVDAIESRMRRIDKADAQAMESFTRQVKVEKAQVAMGSTMKPEKVQEDVMEFQMRRVMLEEAHEVIESLRRQVELNEEQHEAKDSLMKADEVQIEFLLLQLEIESLESFERLVKLEKAQEVIESLGRRQVKSETTHDTLESLINLEEEKREAMESLMRRLDLEEQEFSLRQIMLTQVREALESFWVRVKLEIEKREAMESILRRFELVDAHEAMGSFRRLVMLEKAQVAIDSLKKPDEAQDAMQSLIRRIKSEEAREVFEFIRRKEKLQEMQQEAIVSLVNAKELQEPMESLLERFESESLESFKRLVMLEKAQEVIYSMGWWQVKSEKAHEAMESLESLRKLEEEKREAMESVMRRLDLEEQESSSRRFSLKKVKRDLDFHWGLVNHKEREAMESILRRFELVDAHEAMVSFRREFNSEKVQVAIDSYREAQDTVQFLVRKVISEEFQEPLESFKRSGNLVKELREATASLMKVDEEQGALHFLMSQFGLASFMRLVMLDKAQDSMESSRRKQVQLEKAHEAMESLLGQLESQAMESFMILVKVEKAYETLESLINPEEEKREAMESLINPEEEEREAMESLMSLMRSLSYVDREANSRRIMLTQVHEALESYLRVKLENEKREAMESITRRLESVDAHEAMVSFRRRVMLQKVLVAIVSLKKPDEAQDAMQSLIRRIKYVEDRVVFVFSRTKEHLEEMQQEAIVSLVNAKELQEPMESLLERFQSESLEWIRILAELEMAQDAMKSFWRKQVKLWKAHEAMESLESLTKLKESLVLSLSYVDRETNSRRIMLTQVREALESFRVRVKLEKEKRDAMESIRRRFHVVDMLEAMLSFRTQANLENLEKANSPFGSLWEQDDVESRIKPEEAHDTFHSRMRLVVLEKALKALEIFRGQGAVEMAQWLWRGSDFFKNSSNRREILERRREVLRAHNARHNLIRRSVTCWRVYFNSEVIKRRAVSNQKLRKFYRSPDLRLNFERHVGVITAIYFISGGLTFEGDASLATKMPFDLDDMAEGWDYSVTDTGTVVVKEKNPVEWIVAVEYRDVARDKEDAAFDERQLILTNPSISKRSSPWTLMT